MKKYKCFTFSFFHLPHITRFQYCRIASHHAVNKMTEHNIATVFAPTLIATPPHLTDLAEEIFALTFLVTHCQAVFMKN